MPLPIEIAVSRFGIGESQPDLWSTLTVPSNPCPVCKEITFSHPTANPYDDVWYCPVCGAYGIESHSRTFGTRHESIISGN